MIADDCPDLRTWCAWCDKPTDGLGPVKPGERVSHGICAECARRFR